MPQHLVVIQVRSMPWPWVHILKLSLGLSVAMEGRDTIPASNHLGDLKLKDFSLIILEIPELIALSGSKGSRQEPVATAPGKIMPLGRALTGTMILEMLLDIAWHMYLRIRP